MGKFSCVCGQIAIDQADFVKNKAHIIADQDYLDFLRVVEKTEMSDTVVKYFNKVFQCNACSRLIIFRGDNNEGVFFVPERVENGKNILRSYLGEKWKGTLSANFNNEQGEIFWDTNMESGFRQNLSFSELKDLYQKKFEELSKLNILRHSFLKIDGRVEHEFKSED